MLEIYKDTTVKPINPIILDIGCSVGTESIKLIEAFPDFRQLISIDPFHENTNKVKQLIETKGLSDRWSTECCAIGLNNEEVWVTYGTCSESKTPSCGLPMELVGNLVDINNIRPESNRLIETKRIINICPNPDIMKIDIEGFEWVMWEEIFGIESVKLIFLELHGQGGLDLGAKLKVVRDKGFSIKAYQHQSMDSTNTNHADIEAYSPTPGNYIQITLERP